MKQKPRAIDLFCGCGGLTLGLKQARVGVVGAVYSDRLAVGTVMIKSLLTLILGVCFGEAAFAQQHLIVFTDGNAIYKADCLEPNSKVVVIGPVQEPNISFGHPFVTGKYLWYDRTELDGTHGQRIFRSDLKTGSNLQMTSDRRGHSSDYMPVASDFLKGYLFHTNRSGTDWLVYWSGKLRYGYGAGLEDNGAACWELNKDYKHVLYVATYGYEGIRAYVQGHYKYYGIPEWAPYQIDKSLYLSPNRVSMTLDRRFLISDSSLGFYYLVPGQDANALAPSTCQDAFISQDGTRIVYTIYTPTGTPYTAGYQMSYQIFSAEFDPATMEHSNVQQVIAGAPENPYYSCWPTWCSDSMFFNCSYASIKLNFAEPNSDAIKLAGSVLIPPDVNFNTVDINLGGFDHTFHLGEKTFRLSPKVVKRASKMGRWSITYNNGSFADSLVANGLTNSDIKTDLSLDLTVVFRNSSTDENSPSNLYNVTLPLKYTAQKDKTGKAVLSK